MCHEPNRNVTRFVLNIRVRLSGRDSAQRSGKELPPEDLPLTIADEELLSRILPHSKIAARHGKRNVIAA
jgi:hypothetical protein